MKVSMLVVGAAVAMAWSRPAAAGLFDMIQCAVSAAQDVSGSVEGRYGNGKSPYYQGSALETANNMIKTAQAAGRLALDIRLFTQELSATLNDRYGREVLIRDLTAGTLEEMIYASLIGPNQPFRNRLENEYAAAVREQIKNRLNYYAYRERAERISQDMAALVDEFRTRMAQP